MQLTKIWWPNIIPNRTYYISDERKAILISDSIGKYVDQIDGLAVKSYRGATIQVADRTVKMDSLDLNAFDFIIFHVGTNDINSKSVKQILQAFKFLYPACSCNSPHARNIFSSILPRHVDFSTTKEKCWGC